MRAHMHTHSHVSACICRCISLLHFDCMEHNAFVDFRRWEMRRFFSDEDEDVTFSLSRRRRFVLLLFFSVIVFFIFHCLPFPWLQFFCCFRFSLFPFCAFHMWEPFLIRSMFFFAIFSFICFVYAAVAQILDCLRNETKPTCVFTLFFFLRSFFLFFVIVRLLVFPLTTSLCRFASSFAVTAAHFFACRACECLCVFLRFFSIVRFLLRFSFKQKMQWTKSTTNKTSSHTRVQFSRSRDRFIKRVWINVPCYFRYFATCSTPSNGFRFLSLVLSSSLRTFESRCKCEKVKPMGCSHISSTRCNFVL